MKNCYKYLSKIPISVINKSKFLVRFITTSIVNGTYYTSKLHRNTKALGCKNNENKTLQSETFYMCKWFIILDQFICLKTWLKWTTSHQKTYELFQVFQILHFTKSTNWCNIWSHKNTCTGVLALNIMSDHTWILSKFIH